MPGWVFVMFLLLMLAVVGAFAWEAHRNYRFEKIGRFDK